MDAQDLKCISDYRKYFRKTALFRNYFGFIFLGKAAMNDLQTRKIRVSGSTAAIKPKNRACPEPDVRS